MKLTLIGADYATINEDNIESLSKGTDGKIHLIKLGFKEPTRDKVLSVLQLFPRTNRFIISDNVKFYNDILKTTGKKYYIENEKDANLISYLRKNNKIVVNFNNLRKNESDLFLDEKILPDLLRNVEVIQINKSTYEKNIDIFSLWDGNVILSED